MTNRPQKITFAEMREMGMRGLLVCCADSRSSHSIAISGDGWPDDVRLALRQARRRRKAGFQLDRKQVSMMG
jgi:hypothetical protein